MINEDEVRKSLLAKREQLVHRIGGTQATERREVAEGQNDNAQRSRSPTFVMTWTARPLPSSTRSTRPWPASTPASMANARVAANPSPRPGSKHCRTQRSVSNAQRKPKGLPTDPDEIPPTLAETKRSVGVFFVLLWAGGRRRLPPNRHRVAP